VQGFVLTMAVLYVALNLLIDLLYVWSIRACGWTPDMLAMVRHTRYVLSENPVTALSFGLFALFLIAAILGRRLRPTIRCSRMRPMRCRRRRGCTGSATDQLGRDNLQPRAGGDRLDLTIAFSS